MGDDEEAECNTEEQFSVEDIVAFNEQDLRENEQSIQLYFGEAMRLKAPVCCCRWCVRAQRAHEALVRRRRCTRSRPPIRDPV
jgi:hypothetical protein